MNVKETVTLPFQVTRSAGFSMGGEGSEGAGTACGGWVRKLAIVSSHMLLVCLVVAAVFATQHGGGSVLADSKNQFVEVNMCWIKASLLC